MGTKGEIVKSHATITAWRLEGSEQRGHDVTSLRCRASTNISSGHTVYEIDQH